MRIAVVKVYTGESGAASGWLRPTGGPYSPGVAVFGSRARTSALAAGGGHAHLVSRALVRPAMADTAKSPIPPVSSRGRLSAPLPQYPPSGRNRLPLLQHGGVAPLDDVGHRHPARAVIPRTVRELRLRAPGHMAADLVWLSCSTKGYTPVSPLCPLLPGSARQHYWQIGSTDWTGRPWHGLGYRWTRLTMTPPGSGAT